VNTFQPNEKPPAGGTTGEPAGKAVPVELQAKLGFGDVGGNHEAKQSLTDFLELRRDAPLAKKLGARAPAGAVLYGPPGTGKTLLARAFAAESDMSFVAATGSGFIEVYGGSGPKAVRALFNEARKKRPCVIFIDEIDSCGAQRSTTHHDAMDQERDNTLNQLLSEMDGFVNEPDIMVLAATNRLDVLDPALLRAGRFDRKIPVQLPGSQALEDIFVLYASKLHVTTDCELSKVAGTVALACCDRTGADMELVANEAALLAFRERVDAVDASHFAAAVDLVMEEPGRYALFDKLSAHGN